MLRAFVRNKIFERFPLVAGMSVGGAQAVLLAWAIAITVGPAALASGGFAAFALLAIAVNGWLLQVVGKRASSVGWRGALAQLYVATGFSLIIFAAAIGALAVVSMVVAMLLGFDGASIGVTAQLFRASSVAVSGALAAALAWGFWTAPRRLLVTERKVAIPGLDPQLAGVRVAQLSDLHIGNGLEGARLARLVERTNALGADLIVLTGDLFDHDARVLAEGARLLGGLRAPLGVFAVLGNHDVLTGREAVAEAIAEHGAPVRLLRDEWCRVKDAPAPLYLAGVEDPGRDWTAGGGLAAIEKLAAAAPNDGPVVLLLHRPDGFPQAAACGFALVLSGHFHGGQLALPGVADRWNAAALLSPFHRGLHRAGASTLYVSRGIGFAGPRIRLNSPAEIVLIELDAPAAR